MATAGAARPASAFRCGTRKRLRTSPPHCHLAGWYFNFSKVPDTVELRISKTRISSGKIWERASLAQLSPYPDIAHAAVAASRALWAIHLRTGVAHRKRGLAFFFLPAAGFSEIPLPPMLVSLSCSKEFAIEGTFHFEVSTYARSPERASFATGVRSLPARRIRPTKLDPPRRNGSTRHVSRKPDVRGTAPEPRKRGSSPPHSQAGFAPSSPAARRPSRSAAPAQQRSARTALL